MSRFIASRAGMTLVPSISEIALTVMAWPGSKCPFISALRTACVTCSRKVMLATCFRLGGAFAAGRAWTAGA
jgi:hypothetical protein